MRSDYKGVEKRRSDSIEGLFICILFMVIYLQHYSSSHRALFIKPTALSIPCRRILLNTSFLRLAKRLKNNSEKQKSNLHNL